MGRFRSRTAFLSVPFVLIDADPSGLDEWHEAMLRRCDAVLGVGQCQLIPALKSGTTQPEPPRRAQDTWTAVVRWGDTRFVNVEVEIRSDDERTILRSPAEFTASDQIDERWASVGLLIAAMVTARHGLAHTSDAAAGPPPALEDNRPIAPPPDPEAVSRGAWVDLNATGSQGITGAPALVGGQALIGLRLPSAWTLASAIGFRSTGGGISVDGLRGDLSGGYSVPLGSEISVEPHLAVVAERLVLAARDGGREDRHVEWVYGPLAGVRLAWNNPAGVGINVATYGTLTRPLALQVLGQAGGKLPALRFGVLAGLRFPFGVD
jgi:hypothetical protein